MQRHLSTMNRIMFKRSECIAPYHLNKGVMGVRFQNYNHALAYKIGSGPLFDLAAMERPITKKCTNVCVHCFD